jgi:hypothetical protein
MSSLTRRLVGKYNKQTIFWNRGCRGVIGPDAALTDVTAFNLT